MDLGLKGRVALVSGGSGVIGACIAEALGSEGARVLVGYHDHQDEATVVADRVERAGGEGRPLRLDLRRPEEVGAVLHGLPSPWSDVAVLVNSAVAWPTPTDGSFEEVPLASVRASLEINLVGTLALSQHAVRSMRRLGWGRVVHLSTGLVEDGFAGSTAYTTPKSGLFGLTRTMSRELAAAGILVNTVMPGFVARGHESPELIEQVSRAAATRRPTRTTEVAATVVFLASAANSVVTGETVRADGHFLTRD